MIPIKTDARLRTTPWMNYGIIAVNVLMYVITHRVRSSIPALQLHPRHPTMLAFFTYSLLHANTMHLVGNMLFLFIFGNNVEDTMGRIRYLVFYVGAGFAAALTQAAVTLHYSGASAASIPTVGASGAIAGVLGAYLILLPHARVLTLVFGFLPLRVSAMLFLGIWFLFQLWQANFSITHPDSGGGVAFAAHVGGFLFGVATVKLFQVRPPLRPR